MSSDSLSSQVVQCQLVMLSVYHLQKGDNATELHIFCPLAAPKRPDLMMSMLHGNRLTYCRKEKLSL